MYGEPNFVTPNELSSAELKRYLGKHYRCPWCMAESTKSASSQCWVKTPLVKKNPNFICTGCAFEVYSACASSAFEDPDISCVVVDAAEKEKFPLEIFRVICLEHQLDILNTKIEKFGDMSCQFLAHRLSKIVMDLKAGTNEEL